MKADIVIIGGGIIGSAAAYFLARDGRAGRVAVVEPDPTYQRATTPQAAGGVRQLFSRPENIAMSRFSLDFYKRFDELMAFDGDDVDIRFRHRGYLFVVSQDGAAALEQNHRRQADSGINVELLDPAGLKDRFPSVDGTDIALACHSPDDGWLDPYAALRGFRIRAEQLGVRYVRDRVVAMESSGTAGTRAVLDGGGHIEASAFIATAGAWTGEVAAMLGAELPVRPMCRVQHYWLCDQDIEPLPLIKDDTGVFFRPERDGFVGGRPSWEIEPGFIWDIDRGYFANYFEETVWPLIAARVPKFETVKLQSAWAGHYGQNLFDGNMIIGKISDRFANIHTACGFSGHGIMHAPAVGRALAELVLDGGFQSLDLSRLTIHRVWNDTPYPEIGIK